MLVCIDGTGLAHKIAFTTREIRDGKAEGLFVYMFIRQLMQAVDAISRITMREDHRTVKPLVFWDEPTSKEIRRALVHREYKEHRNRYPHIYDYIAAMRKQLVKVSPRYSVSHHAAEADDLIAFIVDAAYEDSTPAVVVSRDHDMHQLLSRGELVRVYDPFETRDVLLDRDSFTETHGYGPDLVPLYKAMVGDKSDNWPGIHRFGEVAWRNFIGSIGDGHPTYEEALAAVPDDHRKITYVGLSLVTLPFQGYEYGIFDEIIKGLVTVMDYHDFEQLDWQGFIDYYEIEALSERQIGSSLI